MSGSAEMDAAQWEALLYDWHNHHRLRRQRDDVGYWLGLARSVSRLLVLGAGTGRVAVPLAHDRFRAVTALDANMARLGRMPKVPGLTRICGDMRALPLRVGFDAVIMPYSTLQLLLTAQDRQRALDEAARVLPAGAYIHIDLSGNFDSRPLADWHLVLSEQCTAAGATVDEWERCQPMRDHVVIEKSFRVDEKVLVEVNERWAYLSSLQIDAALDSAGFDITHIDRGYGGGSSPHRLIYHGRRRG